MLAPERITRGGQPPEKELSRLAAERFERSAAVPEAFFEAEAERIAEACWAMARRFYQGGRLIAFGNGGWASDAQHVAVEFVHPVIVGKRALPAIALTNDSPLLSDAGQGGTPFARTLSLLARPQDMALGFWLEGRDDNVLTALAEARRRELLTLAMTGDTGSANAPDGVDFHFAVAHDDPLVVQETLETLYHILWELVHVFFEHEGLLA